ncbi:hypothetical protein [Novipirellula galeiformis]|uniref:hypothetical protein n=1 Tax=Novipirellula galeiformis TaxID=2528004 RepID=UPI0018CCCD19|nr:hypothetical protein [Novipirellula galeiformis]
MFRSSGLLCYGYEITRTLGDSEAGLSPFNTDDNFVDCHWQCISAGQRDSKPESIDSRNGCEPVPGTLADGSAHPIAGEHGAASASVRKANAAESLLGTT